MLPRPKMSEEERKAACAAKLVARAGELGRLPNKSDFSGQDVEAIKLALGPWPRALEAAGLKPPRAPKQRPLNQRKGKPRRKNHPSMANKTTIEMEENKSI